MKIVNIIGGLGNQMFQYAFALALKERLAYEEILLDTTHFCNYELHNGFELDKVFNIQLKCASIMQLKRVTRPIRNYKMSRIMRKILPPKRTEYIERRAYTFDPSVFQISGNSYYEGYWQSPFFYTGVEDKIRNAFIFDKPLDKINFEILTKINNTFSVSIHVRRGDYVKVKNYQNICTLDYYRKAIEFVLLYNINPVFFIFSNEPKWCEEMIIPMLNNCNYAIVDNNNGSLSYRDMQLMSNCKINIIANSSFSWWGAWLNKDIDHKVIAPSRWVNIDNSDDIYPLDWIKI